MLGFNCGIQTSYLCQVPYFLSISSCSSLTSGFFYPLQKLDSGGPKSSDGGSPFGQMALLHINSNSDSPLPYKAAEIHVPDHVIPEPTD